MCGNCHHIWAENGSNFRTQIQKLQNLQILQGYIFRILQHFATKPCNFTNFSALFLAVHGDSFASPCLVLKLVYKACKSVFPDLHAMEVCPALIKFTAQCHTVLKTWPPKFKFFLTLTSPFHSWYLYGVLTSNFEMRDKSLLLL